MAIDRRVEGDTVLRKTQLTQLYLLEVVDEICKKYNIKYFLTGGTLLGAMRHNGFIPWDDDIDIGMLKPDYRRFKRIIRGALPCDIYFESEKDMHNTCPCGKLRDLKSFFFNGMGRANKENLVHYGIPIDIFPFVRMPHLPYKVIYLLLRFRMGSYSRWHGLLNRQRRSIILRLIDTLLAAIWKCIHGVAILLWCSLSILLPSKIWHMQPESGFKVYISENILFPISEHVFEGEMFPTPNDSEGYLTTCFGDWRVLPPPEKRPTHSDFVFPEIGKQRCA